MRRNALTLNLLLPLLVLAVAGTSASVVAAADRLNVLMIISDDLSAEALACYGNEQCKTPNIDRLANRGVRFTRAYCQFPVCGASRASLMSGQYAQVIGVTNNGLASRFTTNLGERPSMSEWFRDHGYYTARVSKIYHMRVPGDITAGVDGPDHADSWTERFNCQGPEWMTAGEAEHLSKEKLKFDPDKHYGLGFGTAFYVVRGSSDGSEQPDMKAADKAIELLNQHGDEPFFLAVGMVRPHVPLVAPEPYFGPYPHPEMELAPKVENDVKDIPRPGIPKTSQSMGMAGKLDSQRKVLSGYYASIAFMDAQVGRILDTLEAQGLADSTIVIFTSDHGYHLGEHDFWQKMSLHEESSRVPLIIAAPGKEPAEASALAELIDLYPTLAELGGLQIPSHCQGESLVPVLDDPKAKVRDAAYCLCRKSHLLRTDRFAYIDHGNAGAELYDMQGDPQQFTNLVNNPKYAETVSSLKQQLN